MGAQINVSKNEFDSLDDFKKAVMNSLQGLVSGTVQSSENDVIYSLIAEEGDSEKIKAALEGAGIRARVLGRNA